MLSRQSAFSFGRKTLTAANLRAESHRTSVRSAAAAPGLFTVIGRSASCFALERAPFPRQGKCDSGIGASAPGRSADRSRSLWTVSAPTSPPGSARSSNVPPLRSPRLPRSPWASAPPPRSSASSMPCCCGRCRTRDPERLVHVWHDMRNRNVTDFPWPPADFHDLREQRHDVRRRRRARRPDGRCSSAPDGQGEAEQVRTGAATPNLFRLLGARMALGSDFRDADGTPAPRLRPRPRPAARRTRRRSQASPAAAAHDPELRVLAAAFRRQIRASSGPSFGIGELRFDVDRRAGAGLRAAVPAGHQHRAGARLLDAAARQLRRGLAHQRVHARDRPAQAGRVGRAGAG